MFKRFGAHLIKQEQSTSSPVTASVSGMAVDLPAAQQPVSAEKTGISRESHPHYEFFRH
ncbi:MAG: hypothetical protein M9941_06145 [Anaerolineae bacterium]|nr:hypothetical protein [Anaerolineae bacterium]MCO5197318.1 hypothetical protein [Anaerolineae bacterium]